MKGHQKAALRRAARAFLLALILALIPVVLVGGILIADRNTRATGFPDRRAALEIQRQADGSLALAVFDWTATIDAEAMTWWDKGAVLAETVLPHSVKAGAAVIERIIDCFLASDDPED